MSFRNYRIRSLLYAGKPNWTLLETITPPPKLRRAIKLPPEASEDEVAEVVNHVTFTDPVTMYGRRFESLDSIEVRYDLRAMFISIQSE